MEIEIEDLHIQMEDVVKTKLSVSSDFLKSHAQRSHHHVMYTFVLIEIK